MKVSICTAIARCVPSEKTPSVRSEHMWSPSLPHNWWHTAAPVMWGVPSADKLRQEKKKKNQLQRLLELDQEITTLCMFRHLKEKKKLSPPLRLEICWSWLLTQAQCATLSRQRKACWFCRPHWQEQMLILAEAIDLVYRSTNPLHWWSNELWITALGNGSKRQK